MPVIRQFKAMMKKNFIVKKRLFWKQTLWEFILPLLFGICMGIIAQIILKKRQGDDTQVVII